MARYAKTQTAAAHALKISRATFIDAMQSSDFPAANEQGYDLDAIDAWLQEHARGPYRRGSGGDATDVDGLTLTEAKIRLTAEQSENERIKKERQLVEQAKELQEIIAMEDVRRLYSQTVATVSAVDDALLDVVDRAMPEPVPSAESWPAIRARVLELCHKHRADTAAAMMEFA